MQMIQGERQPGDIFLNTNIYHSTCYRSQIKCKEIIDSQPPYNSLLQFHKSINSNRSRLHGNASNIMFARRQCCTQSVIGVEEKFTQGEKKRYTGYYFRKISKIVFNHVEDTLFHLSRKFFYREQKNNLKERKVYQKFLGIALLFMLLVSLFLRQILLSYLYCI